jgi:PTH1 family peptidyl-tRNA hydrolase
MFLVAGLGNPGEQYSATPHNLGFLVVDRLAERWGIRITRPDSKALTGAGEASGKAVMLAKPQTFMNLSGTSIQPLMEKHQLHPKLDLILVYDELDLPWMSIKIKPSGSASGHNGVSSVIEKLGTKDFTRVRLGIHPGQPLRSGTDYLLAPFKRSQEKELDELIGLGADAVSSIIAEGVEKSMAQYNRRAPGSIEEA